MIVHLVDGTYELFRHFYGLRRFNKGKDRPYGAVVGVLQTVLQMIENGDRVKGSAPLPLDRFIAHSRDVPEASLDFGRSAILPARGL